MINPFDTLQSLSRLTTALAFVCTSRSLASSGVWCLVSSRLLSMSSASGKSSASGGPGAGAASSTAASAASSSNFADGVYQYDEVAIAKMRKERPWDKKSDTQRTQRRRGRGEEQQGRHRLRLIRASRDFTRAGWRVRLDLSESIDSIEPASPPARPDSKDACAHSRPSWLPASSRLALRSRPQCEALSELQDLRPGRDEDAEARAGRRREGTQGGHEPDRGHGTHDRICRSVGRGRTNGRGKPTRNAAAGYSPTASGVQTTDGGG